MRGWVEGVWFGRGASSRVARAALLPAEALYRAAVAARAAAYDRGWLPSHPMALPAVSVGNLSVGGTGKTPMSAWLAGALVARGAHPAIVLRGYGADEPLVHQRLNPDVPVVVAPDRVAGAREARARGADLVVLDDAFQHRRARRVADVVLLSADSWRGEPHLLPAGPFREPLGALGRASLVVVTRKAASLADAERVLAAAAARFPGLPTAVAHLAPGALVAAAGASGEHPLDAVAGAHVHAIAAIGEPRPFIQQMEKLGALVQPSLFDDHHHFSAAEAAALARRTASDALAVCTLKDAVKLAPLWPRNAPPLWYVSQRVLLDRGHADVQRLLDRVLAARADSSHSVG